MTTEGPDPNKLTRLLMIGVFLVTLALALDVHVGLEHDHAILDAMQKHVNHSIKLDKRVSTLEQASKKH